jgi:hypothetical protein
MINAICRRSAVVMLALFSLALSACANPEYRVDYGPAATEEEITEYFSNSFFSIENTTKDHNNAFDAGGSYFGKDGIYLHFSDNPTICIGKWHASGSKYFVESTCHTMLADGSVIWEGGGNYSRTVHIRPDGFWIRRDRQANEYSRAKRSFFKDHPVKGFPREAEFNALREKMGL